MRGPEGPPVSFTDDELDVFSAAIAGHAGIAGVSERSYSAQVFTDAVGAVTAAIDAAGAVRAAARWAGLPDWPVVRAEAGREDGLDGDLARPQMADTVSGPPAAEILGVSVQRVHQLAADHPDFPHWAYKYGRVTLWLRAAIVKFGREWERKPGRPRKTRDVSQAAADAHLEAAR